MTFGSTFGRTFSPTFQPKSQAAKAGGGTVVVNPVADNYLVSAANYNYGALATVVIAAPTLRKGILRFDLSAIPSSATCTSAKLTITGGQTWSSKTFYIYEITSANGDWVEGTATTPTAITGASCWNYKAYHESTPTSWAGSAGMSTAGTDYVDTVIGTATIGAQSANVPIDISFNASGLTVIKSWFGQSTNSGIVMWDNSSAGTWVFQSRQSTTESYRPTLTVTYS